MQTKSDLETASQTICTISQSFLIAPISDRAKMFWIPEKWRGWFSTIWETIWVSKESERKNQLFASKFCNCQPLWFRIVSASFVKTIPLSHKSRKIYLTSSPRYIPAIIFSYLCFPGLIEASSTLSSYSSF